MTLLFFVVVLLSTQSVAGQSAKLEDVFILKDKELVAEGMTYDPSKKLFYFGVTNLRKIIQADNDGNSTDFAADPADSIISLLGMTVDEQRRHLWACGETGTTEKPRNCLFQYDLNTRKQIGRYFLSEGVPGLMNDLVVLPDGTVICTDTEASALYQLSPGENALKVFIKADSLFRFANGIARNDEGTELYVSTGRGVQKVVMATKQVTPVPTDQYRVVGVDGIYFYKGTLIAIQNVLYPPHLTKHTMNDGRTGIQHSQLLAADHPAFADPATGVVVGSWFYFMANTNIFTFDFKGKKFTKPDKVKNIRVMRLRLY